MGVDFLKSKCPQFQKGWDADRLASARTKFPGAGATIRATMTTEPSAPHTLREGDEVLVHANGDRLEVLIDLTPHAVCVESASVARAIRDTGGYARGTIGALPASDLLTVHIQ